MIERTYPGFYGAMVEDLRKGGLSEKEIAKLVEGYIQEARSLREGKCPKCGAPSVRIVDDKRQQGVACGRTGIWVQYRCSTQPPPGLIRPAGTCDFMLDLVEDPVE